MDYLKCYWMIKLRKHFLSGRVIEKLPFGLQHHRNGIKNTEKEHFNAPIWMQPETWLTFSWRSWSRVVMGVISACTLSIMFLSNFSSNGWNLGEMSTILGSDSLIGLLLHFESPAEKNPCHLGTCGLLLGFRTCWFAHNKFLNIVDFALHLMTGRVLGFSEAQLAGVHVVLSDTIPLLLLLDHPENNLVAFHISPAPFLMQNGSILSVPCPRKEKTQERLHYLCWLSAKLGKLHTGNLLFWQSCLQFTESELTLVICCLSDLYIGRYLKSTHHLSIWDCFI